MTDQPTAVVLDQKQVAELQQSVPQLVEQAQELEVITNEDFLAAGSLLDVISQRQKNVAAFFERPAREAASVHKFITTLRASLLNPLVRAETLLKERRRDFRAEAERQRQAQEQQQREAVRAEQEAAALQQAAELEAMGETEAAEIVIDRAATAPPPPVIVPSSVPKEKGHFFKTNYKYRIVNEALVKREFLAVDDKKVNAIVSKLGLDAANIVGGIEVYAEETEIIRTAGKSNG